MNFFYCAAHLWLFLKNGLVSAAEELMQEALAGARCVGWVLLLREDWVYLTHQRNSIALLLRQNHIFLRVELFIGSDGYLLKLMAVATLANSWWIWCDEAQISSVFKTRDFMGDCSFILEFKSIVVTQRLQNSLSIINHLTECSI